MSHAAYVQPLIPRAASGSRSVSHSVVSDFTNPWTIARQAPLSMEFSRQEYWRRLPFPSVGNLPNPGIEPDSPALQADSLPSEPPGKPFQVLKPLQSKKTLTGHIIFYSHLLAMQRSKFPNQRSNLCPQSRVLTTGPPGKSYCAATVCQAWPERERHSNKQNTWSRIFTGSCLLGGWTQSPVFL